MRVRTGGLTAVLFLMLSWAAHAESFRVGTWKTAQTLQPYVYQHFVTASDTVTVAPFTNPADQKTALLAGSLDMAGTTLVHAIQSAVMGQPVVVVAALCNKCSALVVRTAGPIAQVTDLRGKKIGYVPGTMHEILLRELLVRNGIDPVKDVALVRIDFFDMGTALAQGAIDAFLSGEPFPSVAVSQGYGRILAYPYFDASVGTINAGLLVTRDMTIQHPDKVQALVNAHARATQFLLQHREQWLKEAEGCGTPRPILEQAATNIELAWRMDADFLRRAKNLGSRMQALGMIAHQPDYGQLFDLRFVTKAEEMLQP